MTLREAGPPSREAVSSVLVFRALQLGDMLCVVPAFRALRAAFPNARITLAGLPWAVSFAERFRRYIDDVLEFPGHPSLPERAHDASAEAAFYEEARRRRYDLALQLHGSGPVVNRLVERMGARRTAGFTLTPDDHGDGWYTPWPERGHEIHRFLSLLDFIGIPRQGDHLEFPLTAADRAEQAAAARRHGLGADGYVVVHPGARLRSRRWPAKRFAAVADHLAALGNKVVLTGSPAEVELTAAVRRAMTRPAVDLGGLNSLGGMAAVIGAARLLVSNDTGVSHIAAALRTPSVFVTLGSDPDRWAPLDRARHVAVYEPIACRPCGYETCPIGHPCADAVTVTRVIDEVNKKLDGRIECVPCAS